MGSDNMNAWYYFIGYDKIQISGDVIKILNFIEYHDVECMNMTVMPNGVEFYLISPFKKKLKGLPFAENGLTLTIQKAYGIPSFIKRFINRPGMVLGMIIFAFSMFFYGKFVFDIKFEGNEKLSEEYLLSALENEGFGIGSYWPSVDFDKLSNAVCIDCKELSWLFVNMMGNVAHVSVREYGSEDITEEFSQDSVTNLVAKTDGVIYRFEITDGIVVMSPGQTALKGDILVSGYHKGEKADYIGRSKGLVFAKTYKEISFKIDRETREKIKEDCFIIEKYAKILDFKINILKKGSNLTNDCDIIEESCKLTLPHGAELPVTVTKKYAVRYSEKIIRLSDRQLVSMAEQRIAEERDRLEKSSVVLSVDKSISVSEDGVTVYLGFYIIENIAEEVLFTPPQAE